MPMPGRRKSSEEEFEDRDLSKAPVHMTLKHFLFLARILSMEGGENTQEGRKRLDASQGCDAGSL